MKFFISIIHLCHKVLESYCENSLMHNSHYLYLAVVLGCFMIPFLFSFHPSLQFHKKWKELSKGLVVMMAFFIPWDIYFTSLGIWGFSEDYTIGIKIFHLPLEEWLFFICIPYACVFTYHCMKFFFKKEPFPIASRYLAFLMACIFMIVAFVYTNRWYTFSAHLLSGSFLLLHLFVFRSKYLGWYMLTFVLISPLFLMSNGVLTGITFWEYPFLNDEVHNIANSIVWYNNDHNIQFRLFTMPIDDVAYGMLMLLLTTTGYEKFQATRKPN